MKNFKISNKLIGEDEPCFIIAEAGVNHNGDIYIAKKLIDVAADVGADAVKFQTFKADKLVLPDADKAEYQTKNTGSQDTQYQMLKKLELTESNFEELKAYAETKNIIFLSTPFDNESVDFLDSLGVPLFKIGSGDLTNLPLLQHIAKKNKPVILSTGMSTLGEIEDALRILTNKGLRDIIILHCITSYPAKADEANLKVIRTLKSCFKLPVGLSDHTLGINVSFAARVLGACVIEKHFTLDKKLPGPDHGASLDPEELRALVNGMREIESALGDGIKRPTKEEENITKFVRKKIVACTDIPRGTIIEEVMVMLKRVGTEEGIEPKYFYSVLGKKTLQDININSPIKWTMIE
ncbi:N-acetylneuraminate synthase [Methanosarcina siciliae C2J]|uniref:N-acetylneuraminate synthase n=2 Tax=Methanosarcina siciliae TaxID=38027 RepID=A0A0E3L8S3_9EURY|nr:N-acetylneuraminate synthase [Methanosarcina siciliae]AKB29021.1 N-acetylneuraminate synthase [Methanosarcina siciliae T4/M]AKB36605.1 N-acetylneuraminate synthase [Methanosarcina siciliae C2J]